jgi:hypothetical protein
MTTLPDKTEVETFIEQEAHITGFLQRVMLADDPVMAQFQLSGGLDGIRQNQALREKVIAQFGYAILSREAVNRLVPYGPFLEVGAGTGYWSYELQRAGCVSIATDLHTPETKAQPAVLHPFQGGRCYVDVIAMAAEEAVTQHPEKALLMVWPELGESWACSALTAYRGQTLVYVGVARGGWTGDDLLHDEIERGWREVERIQIPRFPVHSDAIFVYKRK